MADSLKRAWITWETQRRSIELAKALDCELILFEYNGFLRYPKCLLKTIAVICKNKYRILFVQNPSMVLAVVACLSKCLFKNRIIVDRHSTFKFKNDKNYNLALVAFNILNKITIKLADLTIVTNEYLASKVKELGGKPFVLPDKLPDFPKLPVKKLAGEFNIFFICSYAKDEPISEVLEAMRQLEDMKIMLYISGNYNKINVNIINQAPPNVVFTGFLGEKEYVSMLQSADAIMVLTTADYTMLCGCYEAVSACKPFITSKKEVLVDYFEKCIFVENTQSEISKGIKEIVSNYDRYADSAEELKKKISCKWESRFQKLGEVLNE